MLDAKLDEKFEQKLTPLSDTISQIKEKVEEAMKHIQFVNAKFDEISVNIAAVSKENKILKTTVRAMEASSRSVTRELNELQQYGRRECVEIRGIPMTVVNEREDTNEIAI